MSEYWKSTPKYWCKFCSTFVKDTKLEKAQHEATGKHQGSVQRSLRNLHKEHDKEEREKQRAKDEVARLNGIVTGKAVGGSTWQPGASVGSSSAPKKATTEERKKQMQQLADMGVAVPEAFRKEVAMAGEWQTIVRKVEPGVAPDALSFGVRKRKLDEDEEEEAAQAALASKKRWGTAVRTYPGKAEETEDIEALMRAGVDSKESQNDSTVKKEDSDDVKSEHDTVDKEAEASIETENTIKKEEDDDAKEDILKEDIPPPVVFKKRKAKILR